MPDPSLFDMMHGVMAPHKHETHPPKEVEKDRYQLALEETIKQYVKTLMEEEDLSRCSLISPEMRRIKLEQELLEAVDMPEFGQYLSSAIQILEHEGGNYLEKEEYQSLLSEIDTLRSHIENLDLNTVDDSSLKEALAVPASARASILKVGISKFTEELFQDSLSIFTLLSTLDTEDPDYWYRVGLTAQRSKQYPLAIKAYAACSDLAPEFLGARIFSAQCYLKTGNKDQALSQLAEAKNILKTSKAEEEWSTQIENIEELLLYSDSIKEV